MSKLEAYRLLGAIESQLGANSAWAHHLGNGEWVVRIHRQDWFLLNEQDWFEYCPSGAKASCLPRFGIDREVLSGIDTTKNTPYRLHEDLPMLSGILGIIGKPVSNLLRNCEQMDDFRDRIAHICAKNHAILSRK